MLDAQEELGPWETLEELFKEIGAWAEEVQGTIFAADDPYRQWPPPRIGWRVIPKDPQRPVRRWSVTVQELRIMRQRERS